MVKKKVIERHKPTVEDWAKIRVLFLKGVSLDDILKELPDVDVSKKSISEKMCREGINKKKKEIEEKANKKLYERVEEEKIAANEKHIQLFNESLEIVKTLLEQYKEELSQGKAKPRASAYNMDLIMSAISKAQKGLRVALGMDEDGNLELKQPDVLIIEGFSEKDI
jgi:hypothetical protein